MKYVLGFFFAFLCIPTLVGAQTLASDLSIDMVPLNPQPGSTVTLTARSYASNINQQVLTWVYNGAQVARGMGTTSIQITAPSAGVTGIVTVTGTDGASASITLRPGSVDLLWEAVDAYTPPFYKGKALLPVGGLMRLTAIPSAAAPRNLSFNWQRNGSALESISGFGKSSVILRHNAFNPQEKIDVSVGTGTFSGLGTIRIAPYAPLAVVYENRDGFIDFTNGFTDTITLSNRGSVIHIEPYYFSSATNILQDLLFSLKVGGQETTSSRQNEVALSRPATGTQSALDLKITTTAYSLQNLEKTFTLLFQ